jgi:hypothetical protein
VGNAIPGLVYYPEGNPPTVDPQNSSFPTSFTYQIIDSEGSLVNATMNIQANIPPSVITVNTPLNKNISYALSESDIDAAKYFTTIELLNGYTNIPNNSQVDHIKIQGVLPLRGELSYDGVPVNINDIISYADLVTGGHFAYYPQNIDRSDTTGGDFTETFTYTVLDAQLNESNLVTFDLDCTDVTSVPPVITYNPAEPYIGAPLNGPQETDTASYEITTLTQRNFRLRIYITNASVNLTATWNFTINGTPTTITVIGTAGGGGGVSSYVTFPTGVYSGTITITGTPTSTAGAYGGCFIEVQP